MGVWLKGDLKPWVEERLVQGRLVNLGLDPTAVAKLLKEHNSGRRDVALKVWALLVYEAWDRSQ